MSLTSKASPRRYYLTIVLNLLLSAYTALVLLPHLDIPLVSYDEAWYATIAHNQIRDHQYLAQSFNGSAYYDHPPLGFWLMSLSMTIFGESEFSVRLPSLIATILTLAIVYDLAKKSTSKQVALIPASMLASSLWFAYRARSANLDVLLTFFMTASVWSANLLMEKPRDTSRQLILASSLFGTIMTKTLVGLGIIPAIVYICWSGIKTGDRPSKITALKRVSLMTFLTVLPWYLYNTISHQDFLSHHFLTIGTRKGSDNTFTLAALQQTLLYLRSGVGKWYLPSLAGLITCIPMWVAAKNKHAFSINIIWFLGVGIPFFVSAKTEVWHLIPLYVPLFLVATNALHQGIVRLQLSKKIMRLFEHTITLVVVVIAFSQTTAILSLLRASTEYDHKDIARRAQDITTPVAINAPFLPTFVYYSGLENVHPLFLDPTSYATIITCLESDSCNTVFVVDKSDKMRLEEDGHTFTIRGHNDEFYMLQNVRE